MPLTVRDALGIGPLRRARVVAGSKGLDKLITFVNIMEVPQVANWMRGGELLLTAGYALKDNAKLRQQIIYDLVGKGVAAFGIKPGQYLDEVPEDMIEHADSMGLPLLELPSDVPYMDIMLPIFELLINEQLYWHRRAEEIHDLLVSVILGGTGLHGVCRALAQFTSNPVFIFGQGACLGSGYPPVSVSLSEEDILMAVRRKLDSGPNELEPHRASRIQPETNVPACVIVPVGTLGTPDGYIVIPELNRSLSEIEIRGIETGAAIVAFEFMKERAISETEIRIQGGLLDELLNGRFDNEEIVVRRAAHSGFSLRGGLAVFAISLVPTTQVHTDQVYTEAIHLLRSRFSTYPGGMISLKRGDRIVGLVHCEDHAIKDLSAKLEEVQLAFVSRFPRLGLRAGVGRSYEGAGHVKTSYEEARVALDVALSLQGYTKPVFFADMGPLRVLFPLRDQPCVDAYCEEMLGQLRFYDSKNKSDLLRTLKVYLQNNGNLRKTASELVLHKNSVLYRLKKIEEVAGINLEDAETRFGLMLALKLEHLRSR